MTDLERAKALWNLLDRIDTLDDACREDDAAFRREARKHLTARHDILETDGYELHVPPEASRR